MLKPILTPQQPPSRHVYTVSELNRSAKQVLESEIGTVWLEGEISNLTKAASGHWYFSLKDQSAQIRCAMFRFKTKLIQFNVNEGDRVVVKGQVSLYENRGDYQLITSFMEPAGLGNLQAKLNELIRKLGNEGLFAEEQKRSLPFLPTKIGVISSPSGAAIHDVLTVLKRRCPMVPVVLYPSLVQGLEAEKGLLSALSTANQRAECDVLLITRGGGSIEDLWSFNSEKLAYAIRESRIPVVAAVGHEVDITIAELAADLRAATPSAAAELLVPDQMELRQRIDANQITISRNLSHTINHKQSQLNQLQIKIIDPKSLLKQYRLDVEKLSKRLEQILANQLQQKRNALHQLELVLSRQNPTTKIQLAVNQLGSQKKRLRELSAQKIAQLRQQLEATGRALNTVSPLATLGRGFSIARDSSGKILNHKKDFANQQSFRLLIVDGEIKAKSLE